MYPPPMPSEKVVRSLMTLVGALVLGVGVAVLIACVHKPPDGPNRRLTGTCEGACDLYTACKRDDDASVTRACVAECQDVFTDSESLRMFESLECAKVIAFVEGPNGREPSGDAETGEATAASEQPLRDQQ
jgi:hypothetical protein